ncbi:hypothetical protein [Falsiroseomonas sp.]|uniref:hypothetical protein n=1 Tax=Falsiroseomonas sp. TaxID=2870721 RepID=UPI0035688597
MPGRRWPALQAVLVLSSLMLILPSSARAWSVDYDCFFETGSADVSSHCAGKMTEAAAYWRRRRDGTEVDYYTRRSTPPCLLLIEVHGLAPDGGSPAEKRQLSLLRALAVMAVLQAAGVPIGAFMPIGFDDTGLLVPNAGLILREHRGTRLRIGSSRC